MNGSIHDDAPDARPDPDPAEVPDPTALDKLMHRLASPFDPSEVKWKPAVVSGSRCMAMAYVDARVIQDRLDDILGVAGWQDDYELLPDNSVVCRLRCHLDDEWITKVDVGGPSEQPDGGDRMKAAFSDALKRAAVKFGVGRYLYRLPSQWVDYDAQKRQMVRKPTLPTWAIPAGWTPPPTPAPAPTPTPSLPAPPPAPAVQPQPSRPAEPARTLPTNGKELEQRLYAHDAEMAKQGLCKPGGLVEHVRDVGNRAGYGKDIVTWGPMGIQSAIATVKDFVASKSVKGAQP